MTTVAGLTPLLMEQSGQAQILIPLAASIVFGMGAATVLVLIVIPCLYTILDDFGLTRRPPPPEEHASAELSVLEDATEPAPPREQPKEPASAEEPKPKPSQEPKPPKES